MSQTETGGKYGASFDLDNAVICRNVRHVSSWYSLPIRNLSYTMPHLTRVMHITIELLESLRNCVSVYLHKPKMAPIDITGAQMIPNTFSFF